MTAVPAAALWLLLAVAMLDPAVDDVDSFEYQMATETRLPVFREAPPARPWRPDTGFRITAVGHLACQRGRLGVYLGDPPRPLHARVKTWLDGVTPVISYDDTTGGVAVRVQALAAPLDGVPGGVGLLRITLTGGPNVTRVPVAVAYIADAGLAIRWPEYDPAAGYVIEGDHCLRDGRVLYTFPVLPELHRGATLDLPYQEPFQARDVAALASTPVAVARYALTLSPGQRRSLVFRMPEVSLTPALALPALRRVDFDEEALRAEKQWSRWLAGQPMVRVPEAKVDEAYRAALVRLHGLGAGADGMAGLRPEERDSLLGAELQRGLVLYRAGPGTRGLSLSLSARRARLHVARDEPRRALAILYALLLHSSATHAFAEAVPAEWGRRWRYDRWGYPLDVQAAGEYVRLLQEMLVRAEGDTLRLFGSVSPAWLAGGESVKAVRIPTPWGDVTTELSTTDSGIEVTLPVDLKPTPAAVMIKIPWFLTPARITLDGVETQAVDGWVRGSFGARVLRCEGGLSRFSAEPSYQATIRAYRREYAALAAALVEAGGRLETWAPPAPLSYWERQVRLEALEGNERHQR